MVIVLQVDAPPHMAQGIKEAIAMDLEKYGKVKVLEVRTEIDTKTEQLRIGGTR